VSECPDVKNYKWRLNPVWHRMLYSCTHMATVGFKGVKYTQDNTETKHNPEKQTILKTQQNKTTLVQSPFESMLNSSVVSYSLYDKKRGGLTLHAVLYSDSNNWIQFNTYLQLFSRNLTICLKAWSHSRVARCWTCSWRCCWVRSVPRVSNTLRRILSPTSFRRQWTG